MIFSRDGEGNRVRMTEGEAARLLVVAVVAQAVEDILAGREDVGWLGGEACRHWCEWVDLEPEAVRRDVEGRLGRGRRRRGEAFSEEQLAWAVGVHERGGTWAQAAAGLGVSEYTLRAVLRGAGYETGYRTDRVDRKRSKVLEV